jgi:hypothetical protein
MVWFVQSFLAHQYFQIMLPINVFGLSFGKQIAVDDIWPDGWRRMALVYNLQTCDVRWLFRNLGLYDRPIYIRCQNVWRLFIFRMIINLLAIVRVFLCALLQNIFLLIAFYPDRDKTD